MTTILIARHGNTFDLGDQVVRVGLKSDLPLSISGKLQAQKIGTYLQQHAISIDAVFTSTLVRTISTAEILLHTAGITIPIQPEAMFDEIDYGPDEAKTDQQVINRIGAAALDAWDQTGAVPPGWLCDPTAIINAWQKFAARCLTLYPDRTVLIVTSNGVARFAPYITTDIKNFTAKNKLKLATGSISALKNTGNGWQVEFWNKLL